MTATLTRNIEDVARDLVEKCRQGDFSGAQRAFYADDIVSVEASSPAGQSRETNGLEAVLKKSDEWKADNEIHGCVVSAPLISANEFAVTFEIDVTCKSMGNQRFKMKELAVYDVRDGKITREQFFYKGE